MWVVVNRDRTPEIPKRYHVSAYPTLLFLNPEDEKVHRVRGYHETDELLEELDEALLRWNLYRRGEVWDKPTPRPERITDTGGIVSIPAPSEEVPAGIVPFGADLFVGQIGKLFRVDRKTGAVKDEHELPSGVLDLATDGKVLYALTGGWTAGRPIHVIDPGSGEVLREIVTEENRENRAHGAKGIAFAGGSLWVLEGMRGALQEVDPETGEKGRRLETGVGWLSGLGFDGERFVAGSRSELLFLDRKTGKPDRRIPVNYWIRSVAAADGALYLMEQPIFGFDRHHERIRVWPQRTVIYRLALPAPDENTDDGEDR